MRTFKILPLTLSLLFCIELLAQPKAGGIPDPEMANEHYGHRNYTMALPIYIALLKKDYSNYTYNFRAGICYLNLNGKKKEAIKYLEYNLKSPKIENDLYLRLGEAYHYGLRFDDAIKMFNTYKVKADKEGKLLADRYIKQCENAKIFVASPMDVTFTNVGKDINSEFPDYYPYVTSDESMLIYTSRRRGNVGATQVEMDGYFASDILSSKSLAGVFAKSKGVGPNVNGNFDEQCTGLSADGKYMTVYVDDIATSGDIYFAPYKTTFGKLEKIEDPVNDEFETAGSLAPGNDIIYFASERGGGQGGTDIYMCKKLPTLKWAKPIPIAVCNTKYNEDFPFMAPDGKTLYFSSEGHNTMGGYDLFYTVWDQVKNTWSEPKNIGYPVNTMENDRTISYTANNRVAYVSSSRDGGIGDIDIWRIVFNEVQANSFTTVIGKVIMPDEAMSKENLIIEVSNASNKESYGSYRVNEKTGKFVLALPPGKYEISINMEKCKPFFDVITIFDIGPQAEIEKTIMLDLDWEKK